MLTYGHKNNDILNMIRDKLREVLHTRCMYITLKKKWKDQKTMDPNITQEFQTDPDSMRSGTPYGPQLVFNTAVPDGSGRRGG